MHFTGLTVANGKKVYVSFNPGWGEPGEWYLSFDDGSTLTFDNADGMGANQVEFLANISNDEYRAGYFERNWNNVGVSDDVVRVVLEYVGYNDNNETVDQEQLEFALARLRSMSENIINSLVPAGFSLNHVLTEAKKFENKLKEASIHIDAIQARIRVYNELKSGKTPGRGWTNKLFLEKFPNHKFAPLAEKFLEKDASND